MRGIDLGGLSESEEEEAAAGGGGATGWKWCSRMGESGVAEEPKGTESWGPATRWGRRTCGLLGMEALGTSGGEKEAEGDGGEVGVGGTEEEGGGGGSGWPVAAGAAGESGEDSGSGLERVACSGLGTTLGLAGSVCVLHRSTGGGSPPLMFGESELGVEIRGPERPGRGRWWGTVSGDGQGLALGDWAKSGDWGGTQNFRTGWSLIHLSKEGGGEDKQRAEGGGGRSKSAVETRNKSGGRPNKEEAGETCTKTKRQNQKEAVRTCVSNSSLVGFRLLIQQSMFPYLI